MSTEDFKDLVLDNKSKIIPLGLSIVGLILLSTGLISSLNSKPEDITFNQAEPVSSSSAKEIKVDVSGAVVKPGVYSLPENSRIQDALIAASGLSFEADRNWVSKNINLAQKIIDGFKIYIPRIGEFFVSTSTKSNLININSASESELDSLPGIGAITAQKIIEGRPYSDINELTVKKVVSTKVFEKIKGSISVY